MRNMFNHTDIDFRDLPGRIQKFDYDTRTDGQPVYFGHADIGAADTDTTSSANKGWVVWKFTYNVSGFVTQIESRRGSWDGRVALFS